MTSVSQERAGEIKNCAKVRILFVPGFVADTYSEIERSFVELCARKSPGVEFLWLVPQGTWKHNRFARAANIGKLREPVWVARLVENHVPHVVGNIAKYNLWANFVLFRDLFRTHEIDAIYTHFGYERYWATLFGRAFGKVTIWNEHWHSLGRRLKLIKRVFYRYFVDDFISVSEFITRTLPAGAQVHTLPNSVHSVPAIASDPVVKRQVRGELGIPVEGELVVMVAAFRPEKRHAVALEVCCRVLQAHAEVTFVFLGEGPLRSSFLVEVEKRGLAHKILAPGHVDDVDKYYAAADVSMLTSLNEPFGYVVLEAMRQGLPVVAFNGGGPAEVIEDAVSGFLVGEGDIGAFSTRLLALLRDKYLRCRMGDQARHRVEQAFDRNLWIEKLQKLLQTIVESRRGPAAGSQSHEALRSDRPL